MPYYLDINPSNQNGNQYVTIPSITVTGDFTIEIDCEIYNTTTTGADGFVFSGGTSGGGFEFYRDAPAQNYRPSLWYNNTKNFCSASNVWPYASGSTANPRTITIQRVGGVVSSNFAGTAGTDVSIASGNNVVISAIGARPNGTFTLGFRLYRLRIYQGVTLVRDYNAANTSSGTTLVDEVSGQNGTIQNPPAGNAQWVFYSSGAYTLTADGTTFSYSGGIASTIYNRLLSADGGSFSYSGGVAETLLNRRIAADGATFGYSGGVSALLYGRALQAVGGSFSYSGGVATFVYTPITGYVLNADGGIFSYAGGEAALSFNQNYPTANPNDYTVSAYLSTDSTYTARLSETSTINAIISASSTFSARLN